VSSADLSRAFLKKDAHSTISPVNSPVTLTLVRNHLTPENPLGNCYGNYPETQPRDQNKCQKKTATPGANGVLVHNGLVAAVRFRHRPLRRAAY
jgi:hypothetical protein